jgi:hypothetical protein
MVQAVVISLQALCVCVQQAAAAVVTLSVQALPNAFAASQLKR